MEQNDDGTVEIEKPSVNDFPSVDQEERTTVIVDAANIKQKPSSNDSPSIDQDVKRAEIDSNIKPSFSKQASSGNPHSLKQDEPEEMPLNDVKDETPVSEKPPKEYLLSADEQHQKPKRSWETKVRMVFFQEVTLNWAAELPFIPSFNPEKDKLQMVNSQIFSVGQNHGFQTRWQVQLFTDFWYKESIRTVAIYLWRLKENKEDIFGPGRISAHYKFEILDRDDNSVFSRENGIRIFDQGDCYGWKNFVPYSDVLPYIYDEKLKIRANVKIMVKSKGPCPFKKYVNEETVDIKWKDRTLMIAKQDVLKAQSSQFFKKIKTMPDGKHLIELDSSDDSYPILMNEMLIYMHKGTCPILEESGGLDQKIKLFELAHGNAVEGLALACISNIFDNINPETAARIALLVKDFNLGNLPEFVTPMNTLKKYFLENVNKLKESPVFMEACEDQFDKEFFTDLILSYLTNSDNTNSTNQ